MTTRWSRWRSFCPPTQVPVLSFLFLPLASTSFVFFISLFFSFFFFFFHPRFGLEIFVVLVPLLLRYRLIFHMLDERTSKRQPSHFETITRRVANIQQSTVAGSGPRQQISQRDQTHAREAHQDPQLINKCCNARIFCNTQLTLLQHSNFLQRPVTAAFSLLLPPTYCNDAL